MKNLLTQLAYPVLVGAGMLFSGGASAQCTSLPGQSDYYVVQNGNFAPNYDRKNACVNWADRSVITCDPIYTGVGTNTDIQVTKMNQDGNKAWEYTYPLTGTSDLPQSIIRVSGGYIIAGVTNTYNTTNSYMDVFMMKIDDNGVRQWLYIYENPFVNFSWSMATVTELTDHSLVVVGMCDHVVEINTVYFLKTDANGGSAQHKRYRMTARRYQTLEDVVATPNGGFIATGSSGHNFDYNGVMAFGFNSSFNLVWANNYILYTPSGTFPNMSSGNPNDRSSITGKAIAKGSDGYYRIAGFHHNPVANGSGFTYIKGLVMTIDVNGNFINTGEELWSYGSTYTLFNDINECDNVNDRWLIAGTRDVNTASPKSLLSAKGIGYHAYETWGTTSENRAYNVFDRRISTSNPVVHNTYITGLNNYISSSIRPFVVKLETDKLACLNSVTASDEFTDRTWQTVALLPTASTDLNAYQYTPTAVSNCATMVEPCDDYLCSLVDVSAVQSGIKTLTIAPVIPSVAGHTFLYSLDFGDGFPPHTGTTTAPVIHTYGSTGTYTLTLTVQFFVNGELVATCVKQRNAMAFMSVKEKPQVHATKDKSVSASATLNNEVEIAYNPMTNSIYKVADHPEVLQILAEREQQDKVQQANKELSATQLDIKLYPNPGTTYTELELNVIKAVDAHIGMYDVNGRLVMVVRENAHLETGKNLIKADVSSLPKGTYFFRVETANGMASRPFIKQ